MSITVVGGPRGGSGKSTVATNLTVMLAGAGKNVLLVDAADQDSSAGFSALRHERRPGGPSCTCIALTGGAELTKVSHLAQGYDEVIIDTGNRDSSSQRAVLAICDVYLMPFVPRAFDVWTLDKVVELIREARRATQVSGPSRSSTGPMPWGKDSVDAAELLKSWPALTLIPTPIGNRKASTKPLRRAWRRWSCGRRTPGRLRKW